MHGRLKVKTTAQQEAERKAEKEKKCSLYGAAMKDIFKDRLSAASDFSKNETLLKKTAAVLCGNPDISTLWNIRKEVIEAIAKDNKRYVEDLCL